MFMDKFTPIYLLEIDEFKPADFRQLFCSFSRPTVCVTGRWAGVDNAWEQEKIDARKMLVNRADSHTSAARFVVNRCKQLCP